MDIRKAYLRRSMRQARLQKRLVVATVLAASAWALVLLQPDEKEVDQVALAAVLARPAAPGVVRAADQPSPATARRVYPYSIVPGGLQGRAELVQVVKDDKVVAAHYAGFAVHKAKLRSVDKPRAVYVSYRKGEQVYWTSKKMMLAAGETLLSDGQHDIRARCGNRIADTPQLPVEARGPSEEELDTPVEQTDGALRQVAYDPEADAGEGRQFALQSFANGAGLLTATQSQSGASQTGTVFNNPGWNNIGGLSSSAAGPVSVLGGLTASTGGAPGDAAAPGIAHGSDSGGSGVAGDPAPGISPTGDPAPAAGGSPGASGGGTGGPGTGGTGSTGTGNGGPLIADGSELPPQSLRPDGLPTVPPPAKEQAVPEPGSLWLTSLAGAGLLLRRRRRQGRPR